QFTVLYGKHKIENLGPILEIIEAEGDERERSTAIWAATRVLNEVGPEHAAILTPRQRDILHGAMVQLRCDRPNFTLAALRAVREFGDTDALWFVNHILTPDEFEKVPSKRVIEAATRCKIELEQQLEAAKQKESLLRPSQAVPSTGADLLRPVSSA